MSEAQAGTRSRKGYSVDESLVVSRAKDEPSQMAKGSMGKIWVRRKRKILRRYSSDVDGARELTERKM